MVNFVIEEFFSHGFDEFFYIILLYRYILYTFSFLYFI